MGAASGGPTEIVDAQIHVSAPHSAEFPWDRRTLETASADELARFGAREASIEHVVALMDAAGVGAAVLASRGVVYGTDHRYAFASASRYPGRFGVVGPVRPDEPGVLQRVERFREQPYGLGIRIVLPAADRSQESITARSYMEIMRAADRGGVPVFLHLTHAGGMTSDVAALADALPDLRIVVDHIGLATIAPTAVAGVVALARHSNVALKWSGIADLSAKPYPHPDVWPAARALLEAFGPNRIMWASDVTAGPTGSYPDSIGLIRIALELSGSELAMVLGGTARRLLNWVRDD